MTDTTAPTPYRVLARKYRPATFSSLIGQDAMVRTLTNAIESDRLAHAFIMTGVRGVGKTSTARILAKALNCTGPDGTGGPTPDPCGECENCTAIAEDRHVDVMEMDAASRTGVDDIRELIDGVRYRPTSARYKVYIIDEVHMLSKNAFNALLKTLEEPPEHVKFIFATTEIRKLPVTVLSRCQRFDLRRVSTDLLTEHFRDIAGKEGASLTDEALRLLARAADGSVRDGLSLLDQAIAHMGGESAESIDETAMRDMLGLADGALLFDLFETVMKGDAPAALGILGSMYDAGADPAAIMQDLLELTHWIAKLKIVPEAGGGPAISESERAHGRDMAAALSTPALTRTWQIVLKGLGELQGAPSAIQAAEMILVRLAYASELPAPADLVRKLSGPASQATKTPQTPPPPPAPSAPPTESAAPVPVQTQAQSSTQSSATQTGPSGNTGSAEPAHAEPEPDMPPEPTLAQPADTAGAGIETFDDVLALIDQHREIRLLTHIVEDFHLVRFATGQIEFRPGENAPRDLAATLGARLGDWTGTRWVVTVSNEPGAPTLRAQRDAETASIHEAALEDPLVKAALEAFPGAVIENIRPASEISGEIAAENPVENEDS